MKQRVSFLFLPVVLALAACDGKEPVAKDPAEKPSPELAALVLAKSPAGALAVQAAKAAGPAEKAVVTGRVASVVPGFAVFTLMDLSLPYCGEKNKDDDCKTPWDYCCEKPDTRTANALLVEARGKDGKPLAAAVLPELRLLDRVSVAGSISKDEHGNLVLVASGWFREERPQVRADLRWPGAR